MKITMYSTTTCVACIGLGNWLSSQGFDYTKLMADSDAAVMTEFMAINDGMIGVPFTVISHDDGTLTKIAGDNRRAFKKALGL